MGLLKCPDCGSAVSDSASACPNCGRPAAIPPRRKTHPLTLAIAVGLVAIVGWSSWKGYHQSQLPPLPMVVKSRPAILGAGQVILFENQTDQPLAVQATLVNSATNARRVYQIYTGPRGSKSIGSSEGWTGQVGDSVTLVNNNYQTWSGSLR